jgi:hypothetical protein
MGAAADGFIATTSLTVVVAPLSAFSNQRRSKLAFSFMHQRGVVAYIRARRGGLTFTRNGRGRRPC